MSVASDDSPNENIRAKEMRRRADIVRRYVAIARPTRSDDIRFAKELGRSVDRLQRLAAAWRLHESPDALLPARRKVTADERVQALAIAEADLDFARVSPSRIAETKRRIAVLKEFLALEAPTAADEESAATRFGVQRYRFNRIVAAWIKHRDPAIIPGACTPEKRPHRKNPRVSGQAEAAINAAIHDVGLFAAISDIERIAVAACVRDGIKRPSRTAVEQRVFQARSLAVSNQVKLIVDHSAIDLLVQQPHGPRYAILSVLVHLPSKQILAHILTCEPPIPAVVQELLRLADQTNVGAMERLPLQMNLPAGKGWENLLATIRSKRPLLQVSSQRSLRAGQLAGETFGRTIAGLKLKPGKTNRPAPVSAAAMDSEAIDLETAKLLVATKIAAHNANAKPA